MSEEQNRFSLRKLSVGLASVLIGVSIFGTSQTVKADTVANNQTSSVTNNMQSSDTQKNKNVAKSGFSNDNQANNVKSNLIQTQVEGKKDQKQDSVPKTQETTDGNNLDADKDIVRTGSLQEPDNQSNDHAENNPQTQLNITKNSQQLNQKELTTNLTQDNNSSTSDLATQKDPSKLNANDFAAGTKWTTAGWTRTNPQYVAKKSNLTIRGLDPNKSLTRSSLDPFRCDFDLNFTIDKNDLAKNRKILVGTVQSILNKKQNVAQNNATNMIAYFDSGLFTNNNDVLVHGDSDNSEIGYLEVSNTDAGESDIYFVSKVDAKDISDDVTVTFSSSYEPFLNKQTNYNYSVFKQNDLSFPFNQTLITNTNTCSIIYKPTQDAKIYNSPDETSQNSFYLDSSYHAYGLNLKGYTDKPLQYVLKVSSTDPDLFFLNGTTVRRQYYVLDKDNKFTSNVYTFEQWLGFNAKSDNLTPTDLLAQTSKGSASYSKQSDGSYLICVNVNPNDTNLTANQIKDYASKSYVANVMEADHRDQVINNTVNYYTSGKPVFNSYSILSFIYSNSKTPVTTYITDVTPGKPASATQVVDHNISGTTSDAEFYRHAKVIYFDDDTNNNVNLDILTGRKDQSLTYKVTIPTGYYLDDNNTSTGYTWDAEHTQITYTFNADQAKNDANPIEIHLKHKHTAITDSSQLHATGKRTITIYLPHQDQPMIVVQTVGYKRTGDLDEATNTQTYTDWVFDADTSNVTVNGQISTQYQAYVLKNGVVNYAPIKLPHINGYKVKLIQDKANPAMFMVSFIAVPTENKPSIPVEVAPSKPSANADNTNKPADDLQQRVITELNSNDSGWTMPNTQPATYTVEVPADDAIIDLSDLVIAEPVHAQTRTQIRVTKRFKLSKKHVAKHLKHRKKAVKSFKKYRL